MPAEYAEEAVLRRTREGGQEHVLRWLDELDEGDRSAFVRQLAELDFDRIAKFRKLISTPPTQLNFDEVEPAPVHQLPLLPAQRKMEERVTALGVQALSAGRVSALVVAGGQGTRLGYDHPKGMYAIAPITDKSLFELFAEQIRAARMKYDCPLPWLVMTGEANDAETRAFFDDHDFFQLGRETVHFFAQASNPILDADGRLLLAEKGKILTGPGGHGGTFNALARSGLLEMLRADGHDLISYFQVDNPLVRVADPRFLGYHLARDADFSCKVVPKRDPTEGLGIAILQAGRPMVAEYTDVPDDVAAQRAPSGRLRFLYGSIAIHTIDVPFAERIAQHDALPWHIARKQYRIVDDGGRTALSAPNTCYKFERFIFDALAWADRCAFVEVQRNSEFGPVKNAQGQDSPASARHLMQRSWLQWLQAAGVSVEIPRHFQKPMIEISPLYAADAEELKDRIEPGWQPEFPLLLDP